MELLLFDREDDATPARVIPLDPVTNRTYHYWHVFVPGMKPGQIYGLPRRAGRTTRRAGCGSTQQGPARPVRPRRGRPAATAATPPAGAGDNAATAMKSVVVDPSAYDWEGDAPLRRPSVAHGHLRDARARLHAPSELRAWPRQRGTYAGLIEKIPYLKRLGITAVELLPVFEFDAQDCPPGGSTTGATSRSRSSRRTRPTARGRTRSARSTSSATWSRRCTAPASR